MLEKVLKVVKTRSRYNRIKISLVFDTGSVSFVDGKRRRRGVYICVTPYRVTDKGVDYGSFVREMRCYFVESMNKFDRRKFYSLSDSSRVVEKIDKIVEEYTNNKIYSDYNLTN